MAKNITVRNARSARLLNKAKLAQGLNDLQHDLALMADIVATDTAGCCYDKLRRIEVERIYVGLCRCIDEMKRFDKILDLYRPKEDE